MVDEVAGEGGEEALKAQGTREGQDVSDEGAQQGLEAVATPSDERIEEGDGGGEKAPADAVPSLLTGPVTFGENFAKKVRKHIDQVRNRGPVKEDIPSPGRGGLERVEQIIRDRVAQGSGRATTYAGEAAVAFEDGGVTYIFRAGGEFWTILGN
jgi:hypothetical protein